MYYKGIPLPETTFQYAVLFYETSLSAAKSELKQTAIVSRN